MTRRDAAERIVESWYEEWMWIRIDEACRAELANRIRRAIRAAVTADRKARKRKGKR